MLETLPIRPLQLGDVEEVVQLLEEVFDGWPHFDLDCSPLSHWRWKYQDNPIHESVVCVGTHGEEIIGCSHNTIQRAKIGDEFVYWAEGEDAAVHPSYRGMGVYKKINNLETSILKDLDIYFQSGITFNPILLNYFKKIEIVFPHRILHYVLIRDIDKHLRSMKCDNKIIKKYGFDLLKYYKMMGKVIKPSYRDETYSDVTKIDHFDDEIDIFWDEIKDDYAFVKERCKEYLNWRYCDKRGGNYIVKKAEDKGIILGFIVLRINRYKREYPTGYIVDLMASGEHPWVRELLIRDAVDYFDDQGVNVTNCLAIKDNPLGNSLEKYGFIVDNLNIKYCYVQLREYPPYKCIESMQANRFHFSYGDYDEI